MENFNKNWLLILLVAVIFGTLGFLVGRTTGHDGHQRMIHMEGLDGDKINVEVEVKGDTIVKTDTILEGGKQIIIKEIKKIKK